MADARLTVKDPHGRRVVVIDKPLFTIGRRSAADLPIASPDVSREHAEILEDDGRFVLRDRGSRYGTSVNGEPVRERVLVPGDRIRLGPTGAVELVFMADSSSVPTLRDAGGETTDLRQMAAILDGLRALGSGRVLEDVLTLVLDSAIDATAADRGFIMLTDGRGELEFKTARARGHTTLPGTSFETSEKIPREVFTTGRSRLVGDLMDAGLADVHHGTIAVGIRRVLCVPLLVAHAGDAGIVQRAIGVLYLDGRERGALASSATLSSLEVFATQAALAIESARLYAESAEKARLDRDLRVAADIQRALLADGAFESPQWDLAATSIPCRTVGGDFYDYLELPGERFGFGLGDVAGKGPPAALLAAAVQTNFAAHAPVAGTPAETMARINRALLRRAVKARFATMFYGVLAPDGVLRYCNAGQEPPLVLRRSGEAVRLDAGGPVLGMLSDAVYDGGAIPLEPGDLVVVSSDGVSEARNAAGDEYGCERLLASIQRCHGHPPEAVLDTVMTALRVFSEGAPQADDITALVLRYKGSVPPVQSIDSPMP